MSELRKATHKLCNTCRYSMGFGSQPSNANCPANICCNYLEIAGHSRIFYGGGKRSFPKEYCDKYEKGKRYTLKHKKGISKSNRKEISEDCKTENID